MRERWERERMMVMGSEAESGFSVLELSVVVLVIGVVLSIGVVSVSDAVRASAQKAVTSQIEFALKKARVRAEAENTSYKVTFYKNYPGIGPCYSYSLREDGEWKCINVATGAESPRLVDGSWLVPFAAGCQLVFEGDALDVIVSRRGVLMTATPVSFQLKVSGKVIEVAVNSDGKVVVGGVS